MKEIITKVSKRRWSVFIGILFAGWLMPLLAAQSEVKPEDRIAPNDVLDVLVFDEPKSSVSGVRVTEQGTVRLPMIGEVKLAGLTVVEASLKIERALLDGYLVHPEVNVSVVTAAKKRFTVLGQVNRPGHFEAPVNRRVTLVEAIGFAGDFTDVANKRSVILRTKDKNGRAATYEVNVKAMAESRDPNVKQYFMRDGDVVTVQERLF